eukprot:NODE_3812_length_520_cov_135.208068_g3244_i0.p3 GENE.NODE_3812_length_520_cov_135.208068_g3244_i0~~NODE_3812_length_520_cov_135.208068_g3244_i0.p3  ORF type:complete len:84 (+),score=16.72 NODE_3812_length_520_cov_135.208068_g3244_i0:54-305(+)
MAKVYTWDEIAKHNKEKDAWMVLYGKVYDVTEFMPDHPGGKQTILMNSGKDATEDFELMGHPQEVISYIEDKYLGTVAQAAKL